MVVSPPSKLVPPKAGEKEEKSGVETTPNSVQKQNKVASIYFQPQNEMCPKQTQLNKNGYNSRRNIGKEDI